MTLLSDVVTRNRGGIPAALGSVCSAQPDVLSACMLLAKERERPILIEATSNQVNQYGGYTGMMPRDFIAHVGALAARLGIDPGLFAFGGDHLGPQAWSADDADTAMTRAKDMMRAYVSAGFTKIHLDCSQGCAGEPAQVDDRTSASRAAALAAVCEDCAANPATLSYVVGTEVPPPGGVRVEEAGRTMVVTSPERARHTLECHRTAFAEAGLDAAWSRVAGLVVQPGLEFAPDHIDRFPMDSPTDLAEALASYPGIAFEAHSTDYQSPETFPELARRHFAVLKVGPALTFAYRQALYALDGIAGWMDPAHGDRSLVRTMERLMTDRPEHWRNHYWGEGNALRLMCHFGYADRIRYYWPAPEAEAAVDDLMAAMAEPVPAPLVEQYFAAAVIERAGGLEAAAGSWARALVWAQIQEAFSPYLFGAG